MVLGFQLPNTLCQSPFDLRVSPYYWEVSIASQRWLDHSQCPKGEGRADIVRLKAGLLASMCYPTVDRGQLRVCSDFVNFLFYIKSLANIADVETVSELADIVLNTLCEPQRPTDNNLSYTARKCVH